MPADAWAVQFPVGKCSHPAARSGQVGRLGYPANGPPNEDPGRRSGTRQPLTRNHMLSQSRIDDTLLVREAQHGSRAAFEELVRQYDQAVLRLALHLTGSEHEAQDVYQEAFLKAYKSIGRFRFECSFYTWIYRIVTNLCLDNIRKKQVRKEGGRISRALQKLTPRERMVFELKHYHGLKLRTVGEVLNTTEETAKNTLFRATQKLRGALADMR